MAFIFENIIKISSVRKLKTHIHSYNRGPTNRLTSRKEIKLKPNSVQMRRVKLFLRFPVSIRPGTDSKVSMLFKFTTPIRLAIIATNETVPCVASLIKSSIIKIYNAKWIVTNCIVRKRIEEREVHLFRKTHQLIFILS